MNILSSNTKRVLEHKLGKSQAQELIYLLNSMNEEIHRLRAVSHPNKPDPQDTYSQ
jgi:hypothetical protein